MQEVKEVWKPIEKYEGFYEVSNLGNIKSLTRVVKTGFCSYNLKPRILNPQKTKKGYLFVCLSVKGKVKQHLIHRLVALSFVDGYSLGLEVNHKDLDKSNNYFENLEWCTKSQNHKHLYSKNKESNNLQKIFTNKGELNPRSILTKEIVLLIRKQHSEKLITGKESSLKYGISTSGISSLLTRKTWKHI